jgi:glycosyltransferase involved in cell wall biosynthesis
MMPALGGSAVLSNVEHAIAAASGSSNDAISRCRVDLGEFLVSIDTAITDKSDPLLSSPSLSVIIPAYNEANVISSVIESLAPTAKTTGWEILAVNDGSSDRTGEILLELALKYPFLRVVTHHRNRGYGAALKTGIRQARSRLVATMDADGQHTVEQLLSLIAYTDDFKVVVGWRTGLIHSPAWRMPGKWFLRFMANYLSGERIPDLNSGLRIYHIQIISRYLHLLPDGFSFSTTSTLILLNRGYMIKYVPIRVKERQGKSTVSLQTGLNTIMLILRLTMLLAPLRIFLPLSLTSILFGFGWAIPYLLDRRGLTVTSLLFIMNGVVIFLVGLLADQVAELRKGQFEEPLSHEG